MAWQASYDNTDRLSIRPPCRSSARDRRSESSCASNRRFWRPSDDALHLGARQHLEGLAAAIHRRLKSMRFLLVLTLTTDARTRTPMENRELSARSSSAASLDVSIVGIKVVIPGAPVTFNRRRRQRRHTRRSRPRPTLDRDWCSRRRMDKSNNPPRSPARPITVASTFEPTDTD